MKKISIIFVMLVMILSCILIIIPENCVVNADIDPPNIYEIDYDYIYDITNKLSGIINDIDIYPVGSLAKGRYFGSEGEIKAADYLAGEMTELGLYDPTSTTYPPKSYREKIENVEIDEVIDRLLRRLGLNENPFQEMYEILDRKLIINKPGNNTTSVDCYITPYNNYTCNEPV